MCVSTHLVFFFVFVFEELPVKLMQVGRWQNWCTGKVWIAEGSQAGCVEWWFAQVEAKVGEGIGWQRGYCRRRDGSATATWSAGQIRIVRMARRSDLLLLAPFCPSVLEPNLQLKNYTIVTICCWVMYLDRLSANHSTSASYTLVYSFALLILFK